MNAGISLNQLGIGVCTAVHENAVAEGVGTQAIINLVMYRWVWGAVAKAIGIQAAMSCQDMLISLTSSPPFSIQW